jgi:putative two-component system response regulator
MNLDFAGNDPSARKQTVLIVDDMPSNLALMNAILSPKYDVMMANNGERALQLALSDTPPDLVLLDVIMPGLDGYEVCRLLKQDPRTRDVPVIFLTASTGRDSEQKGFDAGAVDYITKPFSPVIVLARVKSHLTLKTMTDLLRDRNAHLEAEVSRRTREIQVVQDATIMAMVSLVETRDSNTGNHIRRTQNYVRMLAEKLASRSKFAGMLAPASIDLIYKSAPLHDIGKVGIPDSILLKPGKLTPEEFEIMKTHTTLGRDAIVAAESLLSTTSGFLQTAREIAHHHQEKWDGTGYPDGLAGNAIPLPAQLMAVADVYDALISRRSYKQPFSHQSAVDIIEQGRGGHFNPDIVDTFLEIHPAFDGVARSLADPGVLH